MNGLDFHPNLLSPEHVKEHGTLYDEYIFYSEDEECEPLYDKLPALGGKPFTGLLYELDIEGNLRYYQYYKDGFGDGEYITFYDNGAVASHCIMKGFSFVTELYNTIYMDNVSALIQQINGNPYMRKVKPYLLFSVLFRKSGYLMKRTAYQANIENLFEYVNYSIEKDNGKNFSDYRFGIELYEHLRRFYMEDKTVDILLSDYCFANITNLSDWYYRFCEPNEEVPMTLLRKISEFKAPMFPIILTDEIYQGFDIDEFEMKYPVLARKIQKEIHIDDKLIQDFSTAIYNNDDVSRNIVQLCEKVDAYKFCDMKTAYKAA